MKSCDLEQSVLRSQKVIHNLKKINFFVTRNVSNLKESTFTTIFLFTRGKKKKRKEITHVLSGLPSKLSASLKVHQL